MTGTSMDGIDISLVQTNGLDLRRLNKNYFYKYSEETKRTLLSFLKEDLNVKLKRKKYFDDFVTNEHFLAIGRRDFNLCGRRTAQRIGEINASLGARLGAIVDYESTVGWQ